MISLIILFVIISSGSVLCAAIYEKKYEELLPVTCSAIVGILFLCGILGNLKAGIYIILGMSVLAYIYAGVRLVRGGYWLKFCQRIFTPAFLIFLFNIIFLSLAAKGKLADGWDEFSHWADIVKVMYSIDDFGTNPLAHSSFQSYPPGMSLFQYFFVKLNGLLTQDQFTESWLYVSYQIFFISFFMPFLKNLKWKKPGVIFISAITIFLAPLFLYSDIYTKIYIDPFLGILSGTGMAMIFLHEKKDRLYDCTVLLTIMMLVLAKDAGLLFALFLALFYMIDWVMRNKKTLLSNKGKTLLHLLLPVVAVLLPKIMWNINISLHRAKVSSQVKVDLENLLQVILRKDYTYRRTVWSMFYRALLTTKTDIGNTGIGFNYVGLFLLIFLLICLLAMEFRRMDVRYGAGGRLLGGIVLVQTFIYVVGLCITYMYNFSEYEALNLASFTRYMNIVFLADFVVLVLMAVSFMQYKEGEEQTIIALVFLCFIVVISPLESVYSLIEREHVYTSVYIRADYDELTEKIEKVEENSNVYIISQESNGFDFWVLRYSIRPRSVNDNGGWSIGEAFYEGDIWTKEITADKWKEELLDGYDYVALYQINDYFIEEFSALFEDKEEIRENELYRVNRETKLLERCQ